MQNTPLRATVTPELQSFCAALAAGIAVSVLPHNMKFVGILILGILVWSELPKALSSTGCVLVGSFVSIAVISSLFNEAPLQIVARYMIIWPSFVVLTAITDLHSVKQAAIKNGLLWASLFYCILYIFLFGISWSDISNPEYRLENTYDVYFSMDNDFMSIVGSILALGGLEKLVCKNRQQKDIFVGVLFFCVGAFLPIVIKSRAQTFSLLAGIFVLLRRLERIRRSQLIILTLCILLVLALSGQAKVMCDAISDLYSLFSGSRTITTGSGRFDVWKYAVFELWPEKPLLGYGAGANYEICRQQFGLNGPANVVIAYLIDFGIVGLFPVAVLLVRPLFLWRRGLGLREFGAPYYIVGLVCVMNEGLLFNFGTPGGLIMLLSIIDFQISKTKAINGGALNKGV